MTKTRAPFLVVPWREDFLRALLRRALHDTDGDIGKATFIFPHSRPKRYLSLLLHGEAAVRKPLIMPGMHTVSSLFTVFSGRILARPAWNAGLLDRVGLLLACAREEGEGEGSPFLTDARHFFPWGVRLAALYEECFSQHCEPSDFLHMEAEVTPFAAMLLSRLGRMFQSYRAALRERGWSTPGHDAALTAEYIGRHGALPGGAVPGQRSGPVYIAGFHVLTGTEDILFRHLWEQGARVVLHADPALARPAGERTVHWSCAAFSAWAQAWRTQLTPHAADEETGEEAETGSGPRIRFYAGFDLHSQLQALAKELGDRSAPGTSGAPLAPEDEERALEANEEAAFFPGASGHPCLDHRADSAVILPDSGLLLPVLHHLPRTDINISMGYPLARSPLFRLVDTLLRLQENRKGKGYYWRDLVDMLRHPYIKMLRPDLPPEEEGEASGLPLRRELHRLEQGLREGGGRYPDPRALLLDLYQSLPKEDLPPAPVLQMLEELLRTTLDAFEHLRSPGELAAAITGLCELMLRKGAHLWRRFPIDAECLFRLRQSLVPELSRSALADEPLRPETLFSLARSLLQAERVPFEAEPLVGLQVMGMLETRLLAFRRVIIVDAVEDSLPGSPQGDLLLPEALRAEIGLPPLHSREQVAAYTFFRLLAGAEEVVLLWQEGGDAPGLQDQKKKKSRFVEELLWAEEKNLGRLLSAQGRDGPLTVISSAAAPIPHGARGITRTPLVHKLLLELVQRPVSASLLDAYLRCPVRFFHERAARLAPAEEVIEGDDPLAIGELFHHVLQTGYARRLRRPLPEGQALAQSMEDELLDALRASPKYARLARTLPADSLAMLNAAGQKRLHDYLLRQPPTTPLAVELPLHAAFVWKNTSCMLTGQADRLDIRGDGPDRGIMILDYKTGRTPAPERTLWEDDAFWERLERQRPGGEAPDKEQALLAELAERLESVQLPFYLLLYSLAARQGKLAGSLGPDASLPALDAAWVALGGSGEECPLFPNNLPPARRREIVENRIPGLVHFLLRHMLESPVLTPLPGPYCDWCSCAKLCTVFVASE